jgi:homoserine dehydrogenase
MRGILYPLHIGMLGLGVVGGGVYRILTDHADRVAARMDRPNRIVKILVRNPEKPRAVAVAPELLTTNARDILDDPTIAIIFEAMGGEHPAVDYLRRALEHGKYVITANKEVMAKHGPELLALAAENDVDIAFEASVGGGIPLIGPFRQDLAANRIVSLQAILNGTTNYILTRMAEDGSSFADALQEAQRLGYAEPDPTNDVDGIDASYKLSILSTLAFQAPVHPDQIFTEGIRRVAARDMRYAQEMGYRLKLLCVARDGEAGVEARVHPTLLPASHPLAQVNGVFNAVLVHGDLVGDVLFYGRGAGAEPTGSAMVADLIAVGQTLNMGANPSLPVRLGANRPVAPIEDAVSRHYLRLEVEDRPGVLAQLAGILGEAGISIATMFQKEISGETGTAEIVITTHPAAEGAMRRARALLTALPAVRDFAGYLRIES